MKLKIKVLVKEDCCSPQIIDKGDWIDLRSAEEVVCKIPVADRLRTRNKEKYRGVFFSHEKVSLGVAIQLPAGCEAIVVARSGLFKNFFVTLTNGIGIIDQPYCGEDDVWQADLLMFEDAHIHRGDRICQFRIQLSQKATFWQKIKWLLSSGVEIEYVTKLNHKNRGGFNSTGVK